MSKHTPGPWRVRPDARNWSAVNDATGASAYEAVLAGDDAVALVVAHSPDPWGDAPPTEHNAQLIAAAPDMLHALRRAVLLIAAVCSHCPQLAPREEYELVSAAIAKATEEAE